MIFHNIVTKRLTIENLINYHDVFLISLLIVFLYSLENVLDKYFMLIKYIKPYEILFIKGVTVSILSIITLIITTKIGKVDNYWDYVQNLDSKEIIIFIGLVLINFIDILLIILIIYIFSPYHILLTDFVSDIINYFLDIGNTDALTAIFVILFLLIDIFMILVFIELIELNFCGLSENTNKNIEARAKIDVLDDNEDNASIEKAITFDEYELELKDNAENEVNND